MDMKQMTHKIIGESWSEEELICYLVNLQRAHKHTCQDYSLSFSEKLFAILVVSYMAQDSEKVDKYLKLTEKGLSTTTLWKTATEMSIRVHGTLGKSVACVSTFIALGVALGGVKVWQYLREEDRNALTTNISAFLITTKELPVRCISNYTRWRDYNKVRGEIIPLYTLLPKLTQCVISLPTYDQYIDFITLIYSAYYYLYDAESPKFSDCIFDIVHSKELKLNDKLYDDLCNSPFRYQVHAEYQDYCVRKKIKENSLFVTECFSPHSSTSEAETENKNKVASANISQKDYFPNLSLDSNKIKRLYDVLVGKKFISGDTDYSVFHFRFSGIDKPQYLPEIICIRDKKELSYLIYRLTRKEICNEKNEDTNTTRDFYKKVKAFFNVKKEAWKDNDNISDMVRKISDDKQKEILKLLKEALETN